MSIMLKAGALWTYIGIIVNHPVESRQFSNMISLLDMQLDRAAKKPLDVVWVLNQISGFDTSILDLIRQKGPFSQWRTLQMRIRVVHPDDANIFHPGDAFNNLESISIFPSVMTSIIGLLNLTTTSKLQALDHRPTGSPNEVTLSHCVDMIGRIHRLTTSGLRLRTVATELSVSYQTSHPFPHLTTYNIMTCVFAHGFLIDLRCLETLNTAVLMILRDTEVSLPALRLLACGTIQLQEGAKIITPLLESMRILGDTLHFENANIDWTGDAIKNKGFLSSPLRSLTVEPVLPFDCILKLLERSPRVERVRLRLGDEECATQVLEHIGGATPEDNSEETRLCGQLRELRLSFAWDKCEVESWKERAARVVKMRMRGGIVLRIYGTWKGERTYVLLA
jgi:hypothetical protein